jgi:hypothetical protein
MLLAGTVQHVLILSSQLLNRRFRDPLTRVLKTPPMQTHFRHGNSGTPVEMGILPQCPACCRVHNGTEMHAEPGAVNGSPSMAGAVPASLGDSQSLISPPMDRRR